MDCSQCEKRATCREICPEIEAQLPSVNAGKLRLKKAIPPGEKMKMVERLFDCEHLLTPRERCVLYLLYRTSLPAAVIAAGLRVSPSTVHSTLRRIAGKIAAKRADSSLIRGMSRKSTSRSRRSRAA